MVSAIRYFPFVQRVLCSTYGETAPGRDALIDALELSGEHLTQLTKRLSKKFAELGILSIQGAASSKHNRHVSEFCDLVVNKLESELLYRAQHASEDVDAMHARNTLRTTILRSMASAMVYRAIEIAPTEGAALLNAAGDTAPVASKQQPLSTVSSSSLATLQRLFDSRGFGSLNPTLEREEIDLDVFLAMRHEELVKTFQLSFGLAKKLEILQQDLKSKIQNRGK